MDVIDIMGLVVIAVGLFILSPTLSYTLYRFHRMRRVSMMKCNRNYPLIYALNFLVLFTLIFQRTYTCSVQIWNILKVPQWTTYVGDGVCVWLIYLLFAVKTWLLYFEQKHHISLINLTWKKLINQYTKSWHINARHKYGNYKYLLKIGTIPYIVYIVIEVTCNIYLQRSNYHLAIRIITAFIYFLLSAFPLLFCCIIYYKSRSLPLNGTNKISNIYEIKYQCVVIVAYLVGETLCIIVCTYFNSTTNNANLRRMESLFDLILTYILLFGIAILTTTYPIFLYHQQSQSSSVSHSMRHKRSKRLNLANVMGIRQMAQVIRNIDGFKHFMLHILHEYSTENLVFLVELIQIKYSFQQRNNNLLLVPKHPIYESTEDVMAWYPTNPSFNVIADSQSGSDTDNVVKSTPDILETAETLTVNNKKHQEQCTSSTTIPSNERSNMEFEDDDKYMVLDFNPIEAMYDPHKERSPSPPAPIPISISESAPLPTISRDRAPTESVTRQSPTNSPVIAVKIPDYSTFFRRARSMSLSRTFSKKKKEPQTFSYLLNNNGTILMKMELPPGLPKSAVLDDSTKANNFALEMEYLYNKFVKIGSHLEINISHDLRTSLMKVFETEKMHLNPKKESFLFTVFDEVAHSILDLMLDSYHRFIITDKFKELEIEMDDINTGAGHAVENSISTLEAKATVQTDGSTPKTPPYHMNDDATNYECRLIHHASSYDKLSAQYDTR